MNETTAIICILLLLPLVTSASEEISSTSRLVGNTPEDIINQLDVEELNLNHASYFGKSTSGTRNAYQNKEDILNLFFSNPYTVSDWDYGTLNTNLFGSNELFMIEATGLIQDNKIKSEQSSSILTTSLTQIMLD
jgi:hypothetical protein